jgi:hypothetical protein
VEILKFCPICFGIIWNSFTASSFVFAHLSIAYHCDWVPLRPSDLDFGKNWKPRTVEIPLLFLSDPKGYFRCMKSTHHLAWYTNQAALVNMWRYSDWVRPGLFNPGTWPQIWNSSLRGIFSLTLIWFQTGKHDEIARLGCFEFVLGVFLWGKRWIQNLFGIPTDVCWHSYLFE